MVKRMRRQSTDEKTPAKETTDKILYPEYTKNS